MSDKQSKNEELIENQLRFAIQARGEPAMISGSAKVAQPHEIKIDESHRVLNSPASSGGNTFLCGTYRRFVGDDVWGWMVHSISISIALDVSERAYWKS